MKDCLFTYVIAQGGTLQELDLYSLFVIDASCSSVVNVQFQFRPENYTSLVDGHVGIVHCHQILHQAAYGLVTSKWGGS